MQCTWLFLPHEAHILCVQAQGWIWFWAVLYILHHIKKYFLCFMICNSRCPVGPWADITHNSPLTCSMTHLPDDVTYEKEGFCNRFCNQQYFGSSLQEAGVEIKARGFHVIGKRSTTKLYLQPSTLAQKSLCMLRNRKRCFCSSVF